jgi:ubiquinone/menaquinone biosynthesis C-methylase UbiE
MDHEMTVEQIRAIYEGCAPWYDWSQWIFEVLLIGRMRRRLLSRARGRVLEVGIGTGVNLRYYAPSCAILGVDLSRPMLERAVQRAHALERQLMVEVMDAEDLALPDQSFDTVVSTLTLCTTPQPVRLLREMRRVCRAEGRVLLLEHGLGTDIWVNRLLSHFAPGQLARYACHLTRNVADLPEQAGLKVLRTQRRVFGTLTLIEAQPSW